jgi:hypothetical protein
MRLPLPLACLLMCLGASCSRHATAPAKADAVTSARAPSVPGPPPTREPYVEPVEPKLEPPDPIVIRCTSQEYPDGWAGLRSCLNGAQAHLQEVYDAGHKMGAARPPTINPAWAIPGWYFSSAGLDSNTGVDSGHPLRHHYELYGRWETDSPLTPTPQVTSLTWLTDQAATILLAIADPLHVRCAGFGQVNIIGTPSVTASGTLSNVTNLSRAAGSFAQATLSSFSSPLAHPFIIDSTANAAMSVQTLIASGPSAGLYSFTTPMTHSLWPVSGSFVALPAEVSIANGDAYTIVSPSLVAITSLDSANMCSYGVAGIRNAGPLTVNAGAPLSIRVSESEMDSTASNGANVVGTAEQFANSQVGGQLAGAWITGGLVNGNTTWSGDGAMDGDVSLQNIQLIRNGGRVFFGTVSTHHLILIGGGGLLSPRSRGPLPDSPYVAPGSEQIWVDTENGVFPTAQNSFCNGGLFEYGPTAASTFTGPNAPVFAFNETECNVTWGIAVDTSVVPAQEYAGRALSVAQLDTSIAAGGFGGYAKGLDQGVYLSSTVATTLPSPGPYVAKIGNGGTGLDAGCPDGSVYEGTGAAGPMQCGPAGCPSGQYLGGSGLTCSTPAGTGATCPINLATCTTGLLPYSSLSGTPTLPTVAGGTDITVTGGPAYTVALTPCANGQILQTVSGVQTCVTVSGDMTLAAGGAATLASVTTAGTTGDATHVAQVTIDVNGRTTTAVPVLITPAYSSITGTPTLPSVVAGTAISVSGGPAYTVNNTGVTSVAGGTGISVSSATGNVTISNTGGGLSCPIDLASCVTGITAVSHGGTGITSCGANQFVEGSGGSGAFGCAAAVNLGSQTTGTLDVTHGGTGVNSLPAHSVALGEGTSPLSSVGPCATSGQPILSNGAGADPSCQALNLGAGSSIVTGVLPGANQGCQTLAGDVIGNTCGSTVTKLWTNALANVAPTNGQVLTWNSGGLAWTPQSPPGFLGVDYGSGGAVISSTSIVQLAHLVDTISGSGLALLDITYNIAATDVFSNVVTFGESTDAAFSIVNPVQANVPAGSVFGGTSFTQASQKLLLSSLSPGNHTFYFLAQLASAPGSSYSSSVQVINRF